MECHIVILARGKKIFSCGVRLALRITIWHSIIDFHMKLLINNTVLTPYKIRGD